MLGIVIFSIVITHIGNTQARHTCRIQNHVPCDEIDNVFYCLEGVLTQFVVSSTA